jgi:hypothetical protein
LWNAKPSIYVANVVALIGWAGLAAAKARIAWRLRGDAEMWLLVVLPREQRGARAKPLLVVAAGREAAHRASAIRTALPAANVTVLAPRARDAVRVALSELG